MKPTNRTNTRTTRTKLRAVLGTSTADDMIAVSLRDRCDVLLPSGAKLWARKYGVVVRLDVYGYRADNSDATPYLDTEPHQATRDCRACDGEGRQPANKDLNCTYCHGKGRVPR